MTEDALRPDGLELLRRAGRSLRAQGGIPVVFGGLRDERGIRVTTTSGAQTATLTTIVVRPDRGLGGRSWSSGQPQAVADYARATDITHDFDRQILGEGIVGLAVAPVIVRNRVAGVINVQHRQPHFHTGGEMELLTTVGEQVGCLAALAVGSRTVPLADNSQLSHDLGARAVSIYGAGEEH